MLLLKIVVEITVEGINVVVVIVEASKMVLVSFELGLRLVRSVANVVTTIEAMVVLSELSTFGSVVGDNVVVVINCFVVETTVVTDRFFRVLIVVVVVFTIEGGIGI